MKEKMIELLETVAEIIVGAALAYFVLEIAIDVEYEEALRLIIVVMIIIACVNFGGAIVKMIREVIKNS